MTLSEELAWRGFVHQSTYKDLTQIDKQKLNFYWGVDPSADSMTIGNLATAMLVKCFIRHGHNPVLLVGGATGLIGDPDGKMDERNLITAKQIASNKRSIERQYKQLFGKKGFDLVDNYEWFKNMNYLDFLRDVGKHVPMRQMLAREFIETRLGEGGSGISYAEFSYVLIQAYDFLQLYQKQAVTLQVCGSDQWGNSIAGVDLVRRKTGAEVHVLSAPLVTNKTTGRKFGKTEDGAIWLAATKTTPTQFYQFWINVDDAGVADYLKIYTDLDQAGHKNILEEHSKDLSKRHAQHILAERTTELVHGRDAARIAQSVTQFLIGSRQIGEADKTVLSAIRQELPSAKAKAGSDIISVLVSTGLASSNTDARRHLQANAIAINGQKVNRDIFEAGDFQKGRLIIRRGKAYKDAALVELK